MKTNNICDLFSIKYPIIQGGMVWCSGWKLASAVSNAGGLGLLGTGSMYPEVLLQHIEEMKEATNKPWGVNIPLMYPDIEAIIDTVIRKKVPIVFTSAGNPKKWTKTLQKYNIKVAHVVSSSFFAKKCEEAGVDAIVAEGFEAGGHNGREETTTSTLIPQIRKATSLPLIAAGGIATGKHIAAAQILGADGVQIGSRFAVSAESSSHDNYKQAIFNSREGDTKLCLKKISPTRLLTNRVYEVIAEMEDEGATKEELQEFMAKGRAKKGIFEGDIIEGALEIGQVSSYFKQTETVSEIFTDLITDYSQALQDIQKNSFI
ncbi:MAG: NAD(P)H-dependent flavin oxidoreductase [Bacteroidota bacterium]